MKFYIFIIITIFFNNVFANIIYDKNNILISEIELESFIKLYSENNGIELSNINAIKKIVLQKKTISQLEINQPEFFKKLDENIISEFGLENYNNEIIRDYLRYLKIRNEFIFDYFQNKLTIDDLKSVIYSFSEFNVPLSQNDCLTINEISDLRYNEEYVANLFNRLKNKNDNNKININGNYYNVCLDIKSYQIIEAELTKYIELKTEDNFNKFIYAK
tara:strand:- start:1428 stop:2081 length:654 start_codon:yes stop_codon:yes gene_type:complete